MSNIKKRYYLKHVELFRLIDKIKLWPSRNGTLHGIRSIKIRGDYAEVTTHCGKTFVIRNSKSSRAARWLRNKWYRAACSECRIPAWKLEKYAATCFSEHYGSDLRPVNNDQESHSSPQRG